MQSQMIGSYMEPNVNVAAAQLPFVSSYYTCNMVFSNCRACGDYQTWARNEAQFINNGTIYGG